MHFDLTILLWLFNWLTGESSLIFTSDWILRVDGTFRYWEVFCGSLSSVLSVVFYTLVIIFTTSLYFELGQGTHKRFASRIIVDQDGLVLRAKNLLYRAPE